jgi:hypothetical protein
LKKDKFGENYDYPDDENLESSFPWPISSSIKILLLFLELRYVRKRFIVMEK